MEIQKSRTKFQAPNAKYEVRSTKYEIRSLFTPNQDLRPTTDNSTSTKFQAPNSKIPRSNQLLTTAHRLPTINQLEKGLAVFPLTSIRLIQYG
ncbi:MAG: hypothetical protein WBA61_04985 [Aequorivita sp.]